MRISGLNTILCAIEIGTKFKTISEVKICIFVYLNSFSNLYNPREPTTNNKNLIPEYFLRGKQKSLLVLN